ncbi:hypothetical protein FXO37_01514 [Capsicum annuum]|nr:hypothetical protein FXO37_01514 [Capsicum annuum]
MGMLMRHISDNHERELLIAKGGQDVGRPTQTRMDPTTDQVLARVRLSLIDSGDCWSFQEINTNNDSDDEEQEQPDLWMAMGDANAYIDKLYNHYADLLDLAVPTNITPTVAPYPLEELSSSKRMGHNDFSDYFYNLNGWTTVEAGAYTTTYQE